MTRTILSLFFAASMFATAPTKPEHKQVPISDKDKLDIRNLQIGVQQATDGYSRAVQLAQQAMQQKQAEFQAKVAEIEKRNNCKLSEQAGKDGSSELICTAK